MACGVTLKRSRELDPLLSPESDMKRRRTQYNKSIQHSPTHHHHQAAHHANINSNELEMPSSIETSTVPKNPQDELDAYLLSEISVLRRRRVLPRDGGGNESPASASSDSDSEQRMDSGAFGQRTESHHHHQSQHAGASSSIVRSERPLFTYRQVRMICERLLKEQEMRLREEYDRTLNAKLSEQHETFVRFTYDQIHRRLGDAPMSYLS